MLLLQIIGAIFAIFIIILLHEFGHFLMARACGVRVLQFSIGFGKTLYAWSGKTGTEYRLAILPLGGYVRMLDDSSTDEPLPDDAFPRKPLYKRFLIVAAGPLMNGIVAVVLLAAINMIGTRSLRPIIGQVAPASIAARAGLQAQDQLTLVGRKKVKNWSDVNLAIVSHLGDRVATTVMRQGRLYSLNMDLSQVTLQERRVDILSLIGLSMYIPSSPPILKSLLSGKSAALAGLQAGDQILKIGTQHFSRWQDLVAYVRQHPGQATIVSVLRAGKTISLPLVIGKKNEQSVKIGSLGVMLKVPPLPESLLYRHRSDFFSAWLPALRETAAMFKANIDVLVRIIRGDISTRLLSGPVSVFHMAGQATLAGLVNYLRFIAFISVAIGFINLLPVPGLDGGHILFQAIECVIRRPVSAATQRVALLIGFSILLFVMLFATVNDLNFLFE